MLESLYKTFLKFYYQSQKSQFGEIASYCPISGIVNEYTLHLDTGGLVTLYQLQGITYHVGEKERLELSKNLKEFLSPLLSSPNVAIQFIYNKDNTTLRKKIEKRIEPLRSKAKSLKFDMDVIFNEEVENMIRHMNGSEAYIALYTFPHQLLNPEQTKKFYKSLNTRIGEDLMGIFAENEDIAKPYLHPEIAIQKHKANTSVLEKIFSKIDYRLERKTVHEFTKILRRFWFPNETADGWKARLSIPENDKNIDPILKGDPLDVHFGSMNPDFDQYADGYAYPSIGRQIGAGGSATRNKGMDSIVKIGGIYYYSINAYKLPEIPQPFEDLMIDKDMPLRFSLTFYGGRDFFKSKLENKKTIARLFSVVDKKNMDIVYGVNAVLNQDLKDKDPVCGVQLTMTTWGYTYDKAQENGIALKEASDNWGNGVSETEYGDPILAFSSVLPGLCENLRDVHIRNVGDFMGSLPVYKTYSPWDNASMMLIDRYKGLFPYQVISSLQQTWNMLVGSPPGGGKSVWISYLIKQAVLDPTVPGIPFIGLLDIGGSGKGIIELLRYCAPPELKEQFTYTDFELSDRFVINFMDTRLGMLKPLSSERGFQLNFLELIFTDVSTKESIKHCSTIASILLDEAYQDCVDNPAKFNPNTYPEITAKLTGAHDFSISDQTSWWEITFYFIGKNNLELATKAQAQAVPNLKRLLSVLADSATLKAMFADEEGDPIRAARNMLTGFIGQFSSLSQPTRNSISLSRVNVIDLNRVSQEDSELGIRMRVVGYMMCRYLLGKDFLLNEDDLLELPEVSRNIYKPRIAELMSYRKYLIYDEFNRTRGALPIRKRVVDDMKTGRKYNMAVILASQEFDDFDESMVAVSTIRVILKIGDTDAAERLRKKFDWSDSIKQALIKEVVGAGGGKSTLLLDVGSMKANESGKSGSVTQVVSLVPSYTALAAMATTREDAALRNMVIAQGIGFWDTCKSIAKLYPGGVQKEIEVFMANLRKNSSITKDREEEEMKDALQPFMKTVVEYYRKTLAVNH